MLITAFSQRAKLALGGVREGYFTPKNFPVQRRESIRCLRMNQAEKLQLIYMEVTYGPHHGKFRHHLGWENRKGKINYIRKEQFKTQSCADVENHVRKVLYLG